MVDAGFEGDENCEKPQACISPRCADNSSHGIVTKIGKVSHLDKVIKRATFGVDRLIGACCAGSEK
jgi:hypothetical protein